MADCAVTNASSARKTVTSVGDISNVVTGLTVHPSVVHATTLPLQDLQSAAVTETAGHSAQNEGDASLVVVDDNSPKPYILSNGQQVYVMNQAVAPGDQVVDLEQAQVGIIGTDVATDDLTGNQITVETQLGGDVPSLAGMEQISGLGELEVDEGPQPGIEPTTSILSNPVTPQTEASGQQLILATPLASNTVTMVDGSSLQSIMLGSQELPQVKGPSGEVFHVLTMGNGAGEPVLGDQRGTRMIQLLPLNAGSCGTILGLDNKDGVQADSGLKSDELDLGGSKIILTPIISDTLCGQVHTQSTVRPRKTFPPGTPTWAQRLNDCEKIGDSYRGWVESEVELDLLLTYHKQQTQSFWGTRQSPSPAKPSTRLMWKSQYVPFDGIPFVNSGSRAIVLECQYGPRRKGAQARRQVGEQHVPSHSKMEFKQTCPARIYVKKVRKFPRFQVNTNMDRKSLKTEMDKAFMMLRESGIKSQGEERYYVQLPTEAGHEFHTTDPVVGASTSRRLDPKVARMIREMVSGGETRLYAIRKALRKFVEKELFSSAEQVPEKHDLTYYPTVNDLQNHIHQAMKDIEAGILPITAQMVSVEVVTGGDNSSGADGGDGDDHTGPWQPLKDGRPHAETVTVTLTQNPGEDGQHVISRVETYMSDGTTEVSSRLTEETAQLLSKLHPNMFPSPGVVQLKTEVDEDLDTKFSPNPDGEDEEEMSLDPPMPTNSVLLKQDKSLHHTHMDDSDFTMATETSEEHVEAATIEYNVHYTSDDDHQFEAIVVAESEESEERNTLETHHPGHVAS